jgi:hypothetical protein
MNYEAVLLVVLPGWLLAQALPMQNAALILGVLLASEFVLETIWNGRVWAGTDLTFWPALVVLARVACRWILRHRRQDWNYGIWLILMASTLVALSQFIIALDSSLAAIRFAATALCLFFLSPWFISKLPQQPHNHTQ